VTSLVWKNRTQSISDHRAQALTHTGLDPLKPGSKSILKRKYIIAAREHLSHLAKTYLTNPVAPVDHHQMGEHHLEGYQYLVLQADLQLVNSRMNQTLDRKHRRQLLMPKTNPAEACRSATLQ